MTLFVSAGEISGDAIAARVVEAVARRIEGVRFVGIGGPRMRAVGVHVAEDALALGAVGVSEALANAPALWRAAATLRRTVLSERPQAAVLVGNDLFNALLARWLRSRRIPTVSVFPPQVWLWGVLAGTLGRSFDTILTSFPEEHDVYRSRCPRADVRYIGHYLADTLMAATATERAAARDRLGLDRGRPVIALFPGSREQEIRELAPCHFAAARQLAAESPDRQFVLPLSDPRYRDAVIGAATDAGVSSLLTVLPPGQGHDAMRAADVLLATSGTTTLEAALIGTPMVALYRVAPLSYAVVRTAVALRLMKSDTIALPNLVCGEIVVPELKQHEVRPELAARAVSALLRDEAARRRQTDALARVRERLRPQQAFESAADVVAEALRRSDRPASASDAAGPAHASPREARGLGGR